jgi:protein-tyrosine phosphatase
MKRILISLIIIIPAIVNAQIADSSKREVKLEGAVNFRDGGGYATTDGHHVKWGKIYRSGELNNLTSHDQALLQQLSITQVMDFRGPAEVTKAPDKLWINAERTSLPAGSEKIDDGQYMKVLFGGMNADTLMQSFYADLRSFKARYQPVFEQLLTLPDDQALLFHCTAGKDRTGIAAALILYALNVDEKTIMADYLASNHYRAGANEQMVAKMVNSYHLPEDLSRQLMLVKENYLMATFNAIKQQYGTIDHYLETEMGLTAEKRQLLKSKLAN